jgi:protein gp37
MAGSSSIEWTECTWNPVTGCTKTSPGCKHCYAERMAYRLKAMGVPAYSDGFAVRLQPQALEAPLTWKRPKTVFVNSMSDLFHREVPDEYIFRVFSIMKQAHWHTFQVLTKRADRLLALSPKLDWPKNVWQGISVESKGYYDRIRSLQRTGAAVKFLSCEPLLGPLPRMPLKNINWVIAGGESGPGSRPMDPDWVRSIRDQCRKSGVPFFFKQWGGTNKKASGRRLDGEYFNEMPGSPLSKHET